MKKIRLKLNKKEKFVPIHNDILYLFFTTHKISNENNGNLESITYSNPKDFLLDNINKITKYSKKVNEVWLVALDKKYIDWLIKNNINIREEENEIHRLEYAKSLSKDEVEKLWKDIGFYKYIDVMYLPFSIINSENFCANNNFLLKKETKDKIEKIIKETLNIEENKLSLSKYVIFTFKANDYDEDFRDIFNSFFFSKINVVYGKLEQQFLNKNVNIHTLAMCVGILSTLENCIYKKEYFDNHFILDEVQTYIKELPMKNILDLLTNDFKEQNKNSYDKINKEYNGDITINEILPTLVYANELGTIMHLFFKILSKKVKLNYI